MLKFRDRFINALPQDSVLCLRISEMYYTLTPAFLNFATTVILI